MTVAQQRQRLTCRRMILTHLGREILDHLDQVDAEIAKDGQLLSI